MTPYEKVKAWRAKNKEMVAAQAKRYSGRHPEANRKAKQKYRENNLERIREAERVRAANKRKADPEGQRIRNERYAIKREAERWEIAGRPRSMTCELCDAEGLTVFDHCHATGKFRGWICDRCNKTLGIVKDSSELLIKMARYLEIHNGETKCEEKECLT